MQATGPLPDVGLASGVPAAVTSGRLASTRPTGMTRHRGEPNLQLLAELRSPDAIRKAIIIGEMLDKPLALRSQIGTGDVGSER